ncbi:hypothetical protein AGMMS49942_06620 [Spirochaetia bacterium]|nr:hypothetical protein AGMMS49942_06620 [Spirochaetia bacterium]
MPVNLTGMPVNLTGMPYNLTGMPDNLTGMPDNLTGMPDNLTGMPDNLTGMPINLTGMPYKLTGAAGEGGACSVFRVLATIRYSDYNERKGETPMKQTIDTLALIALVAVLALSGCPGNSPSDPPPAPPTPVPNLPTRTFRAIRTTDSSWYSLTAQQLAVGTHCIVYAETTAGITPAMGAAVAAKYDTYIHNQITGAFGDIDDVDGNGRIIILMLDIIDGYTGSGGFVAGYFHPIHMFDTSVYPVSNKADMLFMDTYPGFNFDNPAVMQDFYSNIAHELQHLIEFSEAYLKDKPEKDIWINEGLSLGAEYIYGNGTGSPVQQTSRINYFNMAGPTIPYGNNFFVWGNRGDPLADYATAYLFFQWLRIHASNDTGIYKEIVASPYVDYRAVTQTAKNRIAALSLSGTDDAADWEEILRTWFAANYIQASSSSLYGYKKEKIALYRHLLSGGPTTPLYPGEGVYSEIGSSILLSDSGNIKYAGISGGTVRTTGPYTGTLLTFNAGLLKDSDPPPTSEPGTIASSVASGLQASVQMSLNGNVAPAITEPLPTSYPIHVHFGPGGFRK